jgi:AcrR family transcriptional regulator
MYILIYIMSKTSKTTALPARQARSRETLERLLHAATEILDKDGLEGATIPRIAARAGLTPGAIYRRFPDKDALMRATFLRLLEKNEHQSAGLLAPEQWAHVPLPQMVRQILAITLTGHSRHRRLLRALALFSMQHADAAFLRSIEDRQWRTFRNVGDLLLTRRAEMRHPDPEKAVPFALLMVGIAAKGVLVLPRDTTSLARLVPNVELRVQEDLPEMVLEYLGIG